jgi:hypothetical protein
MVKGKPRSRFAVQHPPDDPIQAGRSLNEAKQVIDGGFDFYPAGWLALRAAAEAFFRLPAGCCSC